LDGALRSRLDVSLRLGYLLAHLRPCCVAVRHDVWTFFAGLLDLKILRSLALH
jgi:hypothetical protein